MIITKSLVSDVAILTGTTNGNVKVRIGRMDAPSIDSDDYNIQKPTSVELVQGSAPAMVKAQITLSDGTVLISDDFMFTTEAIGQDVYISSFVFKNGNVAGTISADIGLSNGSTLTANNFTVPTDPNVTSAISDIQGKVSTVENDVSGLKTTVSGHTTSINGLNSEVSDLQTRVTAVESDTSGLDVLKATVDGHTASISALDSDVANLQIDKADVNDSNQSIVAGSISATNITKGGISVATVNDISGKADLDNTAQIIVAKTINATNINKNGVAVATTNDISGKVDKAQGVSNAGKVLGINSSGNVEPVTVKSGGEVWELVDIENFPTNWVVDDEIKISSEVECNSDGSISSSSGWSPVIHCILSAQQTSRFVYRFEGIQCYSMRIGSSAMLNSSSTVITLFYTNFKNSTESSYKLTRSELINKRNKFKIWRLKK